MRLKKFLLLGALFLPIICLAEPSKACYECHEGKNVQKMKSNLASFEVLKDLSKDIKASLETAVKNDKTNTDVAISKASGASLLRTRLKSSGVKLLLAYEYPKDLMLQNTGYLTSNILYDSCPSAGLNRYENFPKPKITGSKIFNKRAAYHYLN